METQFRRERDHRRRRREVRDAFTRKAPSAGVTLGIPPRYRFLGSDQFVNAIAPAGDLTKIGRAQFGILFRVADSHKRGLVSWDDFVVFETLLKRPDADYWIAFQYFDVYVLHVPRRVNIIEFGIVSLSDDSGTITYDEFKNVFKANVGPDAIPFDFDWYVSMIMIILFLIAFGSQ